jgi:hypothetical protein
MSTLARLERQDSTSVERPLPTYGGAERVRVLALDCYNGYNYHELQQENAHGVGVNVQAFEIDRRGDSR